MARREDVEFFRSDRKCHSINFMRGMMGALAPQDAFCTSNFQFSRFQANASALYNDETFQDILNEIGIGFRGYTVF